MPKTFWMEWETPAGTIIRERFDTLLLRTLMLMSIESMGGRVLKEWES